jgi:hypothetical protein
MGMLLFMTANSNAGIHIGVVLGAPGYNYYPSAPDNGYRDYNRHAHYYHNRHDRYRHD